ncbi:MAG: cache domain-containing protein [Syntrophaceae bacterium]|nr:cache domain-containing protein [Syntrophaceae bacterium]
MKKISIFLTIGLFLVWGVSITYGGEKAPQKIIDFAHSTLAKYGTDPIIVKAVKAENAKGKTLPQIKELDKKWMATPGITDYMKALMENECGRYLRQIQASAPFYAEIFVMDNLGANVAMSDKTSDYWQGDEAKFIKSYNDGKGAVFVDDVKFDDSTQAYLVQVSVPVKDGNKVIGAITFGINVDKFGK